MEEENALIDALALHLVPGVGPRMMEQLLEAFGSPAAVLDTPSEILTKLNGVGPKIARGIAEASSRRAARAELAQCRAMGGNLMRRGGADYPVLLREIPDAPAILYHRGDILPQDEVAVAIVGSRRCTYYGLQQAEKLAGGLARAGITVVSGLAKGIDGAAHRAALDAGGRTLAVTATGLGTVYPPEHEQLAEDVAASGAILTEFRISQKPMAGLFPQRNRIISGISLGVIVIEASRKSGALHTARHAMEQNRDLFALPGRVDSAANEGSHELIRDGATLIRGVDDVLEQLGPLLRPVNIPSRPARTNGKREAAETGSGRTREVRSVAELSLSDQEQGVLGRISGEPMAVDALLAGCDIEASRVLATLTILEMKRLVRRLPGNQIMRVP